MDNNEYSPPVVHSKRSFSHHLIFGLIGLVCVLAGMAGVYAWQHHKVNSLNSQVNNMQTALIKDSKISLNNLNALQSLPNVVIDSANSPADLIAFLGSDNTGCYKAGGKGYYKVVTEANDKFAEMQYGCTAKNGSVPLGSTPSYILAKKTGSEWQLISPTNQWLPLNGQDEPSCIMVNQNKVSKQVTPTCWQGPALGSSSSGQRSVVTVTNP